MRYALEISRSEIAVIAGSLDRPPPHPGRGQDAEAPEERWGAVHDLEITLLSPGLPQRVGEDQDPAPGVVRVVGAGIVLEDVDGAMTDASHGAPVQVAEVDQQVGRNPSALPVDLLRFVHPRWDRVPLFVRNVAEP